MKHQGLRTEHTFLKMINKVYWFVKGNFRRETCYLIVGNRMHLHISVRKHSILLLASNSITDDLPRYIFDLHLLMPICYGA